MIRTTNSNHWLKKYPNLVKGINLFSAEQLWDSYITYIRTLEGFSYLSLRMLIQERSYVLHCILP